MIRLQENERDGIKMKGSERERLESEGGKE
jgi:hypothetical protein